MIILLWDSMTSVININFTTLLHHRKSLWREVYRLVRRRQSTQVKGPELQLMKMLPPTDLLAELSMTLMKK